MRAYCFILAACILAACGKEEVINVEPKWLRLNDFPDAGRIDPVTFTLNGKGYMVLGGNLSEPFLREVWSYDPTADSWEHKKDFPFDRPGEVGFSMAGKGYVMTYSGSMHRYDPTSDSWVYLSSYPVQSHAGRVGFFINDRAYIGLGWDLNSNSANNKFFAFNPADNSWTPVADFPGIGRNEAVAFVVGNRGFVGLGFGTGAPPIYTDLWEYDPAKNEWVQKANFPKNDGIIGINVTSDSKAYVGGLLGMHEYDPATDAWKVAKPYPSQNALATSSFTIENRLFVFCGWYTEHTKEVYEFIP